MKDGASAARTTAVNLPVAPRASRRVWTAFVLIGMLALLLAGGPASGIGLEGPFPVSDSGGDQLSPAVGGDVVVWEDGGGADADIRGKNLVTNAELALPAAAGDQVRPAVSGDVVVWEDRSTDPTGDIVAYDLSSGEEIPVATGAAPQRRPDVDGSRVVWEEDRGSGFKLYGRDLEGGASFAVSTTAGEKHRPAVSGDFVVWQDGRRGSGNSDVYAKNLRTGSEFAVESVGAFADTPDVSGQTVVWRQEGAASDDVYAKDLGTGETIPVGATEGDQYSPAVSGKLVVWADGRDGDVRGRDLQTGEVFAVSAGDSGPRANPAIDAQTVVWEAQRTEEPNLGAWDIRGARLDAAPARPANLRAAAESGGVRLVWDANTEGDLAGYEVYRGSSAEGPFQRLGDGPLTTPEFLDTGAPRGAFSHYRVVALDGSGQPSAHARSGAVPFAVGTNLTAAPSRTTVSYGQTFAVSGRLAHAGGSLAGREVILERRADGGGGFVEVARGQAGSDGAFRFGAVSPERHTVYRARFAGGGGFEPSVSPSFEVKVRAVVLTELSASNVKVGRQVVISGAVRPAHDGSVTVTVRGKGRVVAKRVVYLGGTGGQVPLDGSRYRFVYRPLEPGDYSVSVSFAGDADHLGATGPTRTFRAVR